MGGEASLTSNASAVEKSMRQIIDKAVSAGISTIHIEPTSSLTVIRFRRGSKLIIANKLPKSSASKLARTIKKLVNIDVAKTNQPQLGDAEIVSNGKKVSLHVTSLPAVSGEKITISIKDSSQSTSLESLGLWGNNLKLVNHSLASSQGLTLIVSSKLQHSQKLLQTLLTKINGGYYENSQVYSFNQGSITKEKMYNPPKVGDYSTLGIALIDSQKMAIEVSELARLKQHVLAVLPGKTASGSLLMWQKMTNKNTSVSLILCNQWVSSICSACRMSYIPSVVEQIQLNEHYNLDIPKFAKEIYNLDCLAVKQNLGGDNTLSSSPEGITRLWRSNPSGCKDCHFSGLGEEIGIYEILEMSSEIETALLKNPSLNNLQDIAKKQGMISLNEDALVKALRGIIDFKSVMEICAIAS